MNSQESNYNRFALVKEMMETPGVVAGFNTAVVDPFAEAVKKSKSLFLTGEGSSRIFPAKNSLRKAYQWGCSHHLFTEGSRQGAEYNLGSASVFLASNSGRTKEVVALAQKLKGENTPHRYCLTANTGTVLETLCTKNFILNCGKEQAVAAKKSVGEQALFYETLTRKLSGKREPFSLKELSEKMEAALTMKIDPSIVSAAAAAPTIYFAGYNDGVAEELTLKTNEITRKKSDYLEGSYAVHGIEEVMDSRDIVFVIDPIPEEESKFKEVLIDGVGLKVIAISSRDTLFPTLKIPEGGDFSQYIQICAGWNLLVEIGIKLGINLDKPERARKVGNEVISG